MTPADLPTTEHYRWTQWAGEWWCIPRNSTARFQAVAVLISRRLLIPGGPELQTPAEVRAYYAAQPHMPCPFRFEDV